ncbi:hypothetical protein JHK82_036538 [Glycine max]|nr:hypothetical protein JHK82_036538 [Glycine max]
MTSKRTVQFAVQIPDSGYLWFFVPQITIEVSVVSCSIGKPPWSEYEGGSTVALFNVEKALHAFTYASSTPTTLASSQGLFRRNSVCIEEVRSTYHTMVEQGTGPTTGVWVALLNACSLNQHVERGELAAKHVLQLEPYKASNIVLVSNFYAATDRWDWVDELRSIMRTKGLVKEVGNSWINVLGFNWHARSLST